MLSERNFRPFTSLLESGYSCMVEIGDLAQDDKLWHDQAMRVTVVLPTGDVEWQIFRGSKSRSLAAKWLESITAGAIKNI